MYPDKVIQQEQTVKTPEQLLNIMKAEAMGDKVYAHVLEFFKVGMTEKEVADEVASTFSKLGSEGFAFPTICVSGKRTALPHGEPTDKVIEDGDFVTIDMGGMVGGYCGDMTRTFAVGYATDEMKKIYDIVLESQLAGLEATEVARPCIEIDKASRDVIAKAGYGKYYIHGTGHGVGTVVHEPPYLNTRTDEILSSEVAVTVEPGIYIEDKFGVRIEDLVIVTDYGIINATKSEKKLLIL